MGGARTGVRGNCREPPGEEPPQKPPGTDQEETPAEPPQGPPVEAAKPNESFCRGFFQKAGEGTHREEPPGQNPAGTTRRGGEAE